MAFLNPNSYQARLEMYQKGLMPSVFSSSGTAVRSSFATELYETEFEDDSSDLEEYSGRRSEDSNGKQSDTTLSSFDELRTPNNATDGFDAFNFQLDESIPRKPPVEGPVGPHLFRVTQEISQDVNFYLSMSPPVSPHEYKAGPTEQIPQLAKSATQRLSAGGALAMWTPREVAEWMHRTGFERSIIELFFQNDISGATLIDLKYEDLKELGITSFGHRHRLWNEIRNLRERLINQAPHTPPEDHCYSPNQQREEVQPDVYRKNCSSPDSPDDDHVRSPTAGQRHARRGRRSDDVISPAESASIVAIEQLLPKPHKCSKGENCSKWRKQQRKLAMIATEFPAEYQQIHAANPSPVESGVGPNSFLVSSVVGSSDVLGPTQLPPVRLEENALKVVQTRDPQENVRQFLTFQHMNRPVPEDPATPPYEMFPPLSPPKPQAPHTNLRSLPKLTIPSEVTADTSSQDRTAVPFKRGTPLTAMDLRDQHSYHSIYRIDSPASEMDVPVTAIPCGPIERDFSSSVPPDMRYGGAEPVQRSISRLESRRPYLDLAMSPSRNFATIERSTSHAGNRHRPSFAMAPVAENQPTTPIETLTSTVEDLNHTGWMKKRKTKMLRHEWHENHFRLDGTRLAMHKDEVTMNALEYIDVDDYAVACSSLSSGKLNSAFKRLQISGKKRDGDVSAFAFQLVPAAEKKGILNAATGKTHHFAVKTGNERIDWMRELMLAKALKKQKGSDI
ncbi:hypothetical protein MMC32_007900, partial [Xylographa parallela]|nr:hypothetical protein [Xylographa parallela]